MISAYTMIEERIFTVDRVAEILGFHRKTVIKWITDGELVASKLGREYRIRESDLDDFMVRKQIKRKK
jgi:excisionase family DNA binding protein